MAHVLVGAHGTWQPYHFMIPQNQWLFLVPVKGGR